ncbi:MAG TPA: hypothetical protein VGC64_04640 [Pyrinomonadaceae bacterium]
MKTSNAPRAREESASTEAYLPACGPQTAAGRRPQQPLIHLQTAASASPLALHFSREPLRLAPRVRRVRFASGLAGHALSPLHTHYATASHTVEPVSDQSPGLRQRAQARGRLAPLSSTAAETPSPEIF